MWKFSFQDQGVYKIVKKTHVERFFQFLMLNISSIKELLHKPSEIQWNITGTLPGKLKRKISWDLPYKVLPPEIRKTWEIAIFGGTLGSWEPMWNFMVFYDFVSFWKFWASIFWSKKNSFNFKLDFFTYFQYISGGIIRKKHFMFRLPKCQVILRQKRPEKPANFT